MKNILMGLWAAVALTASYAAGAQTDKATLAKELEQKAMEVYQQRADTGIALFRQASDLYKQAGNMKAAAANLQNAAIVHEQVRRDNFKSMEVMKESLLLWRQTKDSAGTANAYKYIMSQHAKMNDNMNAFKKADTAIRYYTALNDAGNISAVYLALANMFESQRLPDSAIKQALKAYDIQKTVKGSDVALYRINSTLFRLYTISGNADAAKDLLKKNEKAIKKLTLTSDDKLNHYYYTWMYYTKTGDTTKAAEYKAKYDALRNSTK